MKEIFLKIDDFYNQPVVEDITIVMTVVLWVSLPFIWWWFPVILGKALLIAGIQAIWAYKIIKKRLSKESKDDNRTRETR